MKPTRKEINKLNARSRMMKHRAAMLGTPGRETWNKYVYGQSVNAETLDMIEKELNQLTEQVSQ